MDYASMAKMYGGGVASAPEPTIAAPAWAANLSPKDQAEIQMKMHAEGRKRLAELQAQIDNAGSTMADLNEFGRLNRENSTGSVWQQLTPDKQMFRSDGSMQMSSIQSRLAPKQRGEGSGSSSDSDVRLFLRGLPSIENYGSTNKGIREDFEGQYSRAIQKSKAMKQHLDTYGNLMDFDARWAERTQPAPRGAAPAASSALNSALQQYGVPK